MELLSAKSTELLPPRTRFRLVLLLLTLLTVTAFWPVRNFDFVNYDDDRYVFQNPHLLDGFSAKGLQWVFTADLVHDSPNVDYWQPMTLLSRMLDVQLFGLDAPGHHRMNLIFHVLNVLLLFSILNRLTGAFWKSAVVAGLFAVHPLQVEPVAWVTDRKDLLSTFFGFLAIGAYWNSVERPTWKGKAAVVILFGLALMSKPIWVSFPLLLLLIDYWTLGRMRFDFLKILLFLLAALFSLTPFRGQPNVLTRSSPLAMLLNIPVRYVSYLAKFVYPAKLALHTPGPMAIPASWSVISATVFLAAVSLGMIWKAERKPSYAVGWFWFLVALLPALGTERFEDRFMYLPIVGLTIALTWGITDFLAKFRHARPLSAGFALLLFSGVLPLTRTQLSYWKDSVALFSRALEVSPKNFLALNQLCSAWSDTSEFDKALGACSQALKLKPDLPEIHYNLGVVYAGKGEWEKAISSYRNSLVIKPDYFKAHNNLAIALIQTEKWDEAIFHLKEAVRLEPDSFESHNNLATALVHVGRPREAVPHYREAFRIRPDAKFVRKSIRAAEALS